MHSWVFRQGEQKGRVEGAAEALRSAIAKALSARKVRLSSTRRTQLAAETRVEVLRAWFARALVAERAAQVFAAR